MGDAAYWPGVAADRIVGIIARLETGDTQVGSGYLVATDKVLTARHCTRDKLTGRPALSLQVYRLSDGAKADAHVISSSLDIGLLGISWTDPSSATAQGVLEPPVFGVISQDYAAQLHGCQAAGVPLWKVNPDNLYRQIASLHGYIDAMEGREAGELVMRVPQLRDVGTPAGSVSSGQTAASPWAGFSGALVFYAGYALGVVVRHEPWLGGAALTILPVEQVARAARNGDPAASEIMAGLALSGPPWTLNPVALPQSLTANDRLCLGVCAEGNPLPEPARDKLSWIIFAGLSAAGIDPQACARQDEPDGRHVITLPPGMHLASAVPALIRGIELAARDACALPGATQQLSIGLALALGPVRPRFGTYTGPAVSAVIDMLGSTSLRDRLRLGTAATVAIAFADDLYRLICAQVPGSFNPADFRPLGEAGPGTARGSRGWLYMPARATPLVIASKASPESGIAPSGGLKAEPSSDPGSATVATAPVKGLVYAVAGLPVALAASWLYSNHIDTGLGAPQTVADFAHATVPFGGADPLDRAVSSVVHATPTADGSGAGPDGSQVHSGPHHFDGGSTSHHDGAGGGSASADWTGDSG